jgi:hypothetical protein
MTDIENIVRRYLDSFNETDARRRRATIDSLYTEDCSYVDPNVVLTGRDAIDGYIAGVQKQFPGVVFTLAGGVDAHHDQARFTWHVGPPGGAPVAVGFDVAVVEGDRIRRIYGFLDSVPA